MCFDHEDTWHHQNIVSRRQKVTCAEYETCLKSLDSFSLPSKCSWSGDYTEDQTIYDTLMFFTIKHYGLSLHKLYIYLGKDSIKNPSSFYY